MCRSIKQLRQPAPATAGEIQAAALQYVRKVSGYRAPSRANQAAFERAVEEVARATQTLLAALPALAVGPKEPAHHHPPARA
ncbi:MAG: DUF2277 domain-containing protein [Anaerolineales bacterium]|nr:DUF2277 domain-containing protein [Anaerolineales bacterium]